MDNFCDNVAGGRFLQSTIAIAFVMPVSATRGGWLPTRLGNHCFPDEYLLARHCVDKGRTSLFQ